MTVIKTRLTVTREGAISTSMPLPAGDYDARIEMPGQPARPADDELDDLPVHDLGPWPEGLTLRRDEMYGDDGR